MSILTSKDVKTWRGQLEEQAGPTGAGDPLSWRTGDMERALDTIDALEVQLAEVREILSRAGIPGEDEDLGIPHGVEELWLSYAGANHLLPKYTEKSWALEAELLHADALLENAQRDLAQIRALALEKLPSRVIGEHLRALRVISNGDKK